MSLVAITRFLGLALTITLTLNLVACGRDTEPVIAIPPAATPAVGQSIPAGTVPNTSVPDASRTFSAQDDAQRAKASQDAAEALNKSGPPNTMSKEHESKAMPLAGQANDHSAPVREGKAKGSVTN